MNKRTFDEVSDDEWERHTFKPSRILGKPNRLPPPPPPPPIESFAFGKKVIDLDDYSSDGGAEIGGAAEVLPKQPPNRCRRLVVEDDSDVEAVDTDNRKEVQEDEDEFDFSLSDDDLERVAVEEDAEASEVRAPHMSRGRRFMVEEDSDVELVKAKEGMEDVHETEFSPSDDDFVVVQEEEEVDLVGKVLQKCTRISASLREDLYGSSVQECERYAEVEASAARIVTQEDINMACKNDDSGFAPILKPYQIVGVNFLMLLNRKNIGGAILADEMGLGKTVQAVTYLTLLRQLDNDPGPHLIVCPASVLENWERELKRWCPTFSLVMFHGVGRAAYSRELNSLGKAGLPPPFNVLLTSYTLFERRSGQQKDDRKVLKRWKWSCVVLDEAHVLKDKSSFRWKNLMSVAKNARQRLMLTGTPLQNDLHELWSLLEFMMPNIFETGNADTKMLLNAEGKDLIIRIKSILGPFILRRLKTDVMQQLVPKIQRVEYVSMENDQADTYKKTINEYRAASQARMEKFSGSISHNCGSLSKNQISNYFTQFRKVANHPLLVRHIYDNREVIHIAKFLYPKGVFGFECNLERVIQELEGYNDYQIHRLLVSYSSNEIKLLEDKHALSSAKCQALARLLPSLKRNGHRVLIFSQWTSMLDILEWTLEVIGVSYKRLDGSTQVAERQTIVDTFNNNPSIFACLLSTRAGGQGLNLVGADTVIIHDLDFNPQMDRQAEDRCHRIGQVKPVTVYRLITKGTVDENIYEIAKRKLVLDAAVLASSGEMNNDHDVPEMTMGEILSSLLY